MNTASTSKIQIWDVPVRVFHWLLAVSFAGVTLTGDAERWRDLHIAFGYLVLGLLAFRLIWGFSGSHYARFGSFLFSPGEVRDYLASLVRRNPKHYLGHNPAGSLAIFALLGLGVAAGVSGVAIYEEWGGDVMEELHEIFGHLMLIVVLIHIAGVVVSSLLHRENLVRAMITGKKHGASALGIVRTHPAIGALVIIAAIAGFWYVLPDRSIEPTHRTPVSGLPQPSLTHKGGHADDD